MLDPDAPLTLEQLLVYADSHSPAIQTARARVGLAEAEIIGADIVFPANPQLSFGAGGRTIEGTTGFEFEVAVQQQLEIAGEPGLRLDAAVCSLPHPHKGSLMVPPRSGGEQRGPRVQLHLAPG